MQSRQRREDGDLSVKRSFGDAAAVRKAVFGQARYRGAAVRARAQDISKAAVRRGRTGYKAAQSGADSRADISEYRKPRGIRRTHKRERTLSPGESGGRIYGVDSKIRKAR